MRRAWPRRRGSRKPPRRGVLCDCAASVTRWRGGKVLPLPALGRRVAASVQTPGWGAERRPQTIQSDGRRFAPHRSRFPNTPGRMRRGDEGVWGLFARACCWGLCPSRRVRLRAPAPGGRPPAGRRSSAGGCGPDGPCMLPSKPTPHSAHSRESGNPWGQSAGAFRMRGGMALQPPRTHDSAYLHGNSAWTPAFAGVSGDWGGSRRIRGAGLGASPAIPCGRLSCSEVSFFLRSFQRRLESSC